MDVKEIRCEDGRWTHLAGLDNKPFENLVSITIKVSIRQLKYVLSLLIGQFVGLVTQILSYQDTNLSIYCDKFTHYASKLTHHTMTLPAILMRF